MGNWDNKEVMKIKAKEHTDAINNNPKLAMYSSKSAESVTYFEAKPRISLRVIDTDAVSALFSLPEDGKKGILDFASFKNPGGKFIEGAMAQEEALCHASNLYNILSDKQIVYEFYGDNSKNLNKSLYTDRVLIVPNVFFWRTDENKKNHALAAKVIVAAAPNAGAAKKYCSVPEEEITKVIYSRVNAVLMAAAKSDIDDIVLGAFGCGVFACNPETVAKAFKFYLSSAYAHEFRNVVFAIPKRNDGNFATFENVFKS